MLLCIRFQLLSIGSVFFSLFKINVIQKRLDIKSRATYNNRNTSSLIDLYHCLFCHLLKNSYIKFLFRIKHIDQIMFHTFHLFRQNLRGTNIHVPVYLHRIRRNDLSSNCFCKANRRSRLSDSSRACQYDQWLFLLCHLCHVLLLHTPTQYA